MRASGQAAGSPNLEHAMPDFTMRSRTGTGSFHHQRANSKLHHETITVVSLRVMSRNFFAQVTENCSGSCVKSFAQLQGRRRKRQDPWRVKQIPRQQRSCRWGQLVSYRSMELRLVKHGSPVKSPSQTLDPSTADAFKPHATLMHPDRSLFGDFLAMKTARTTTRGRALPPMPQPHATAIMAAVASRA